MGLIEYFDSVVEESKNESTDDLVLSWINNDEFRKQLRRFLVAVSSITSEDKDMAICDCFCLISVILSMDKDKTDKETLERLAKCLMLTSSLKNVLEFAIQKTITERNG